MLKQFARWLLRDELFNSDMSQVIDELTEENEKLREELERVKNDDLR